MFNYFNKALLILLFTSNLAAQENNYDCSFALSEGQQSIRSVTLSEDAYRCFRFDNYADIVVFNADNQAVPFTLNASKVKVHNQRYTQDMEFYQEPQVSGFKTGDQIRRIAALTGVVGNDVSMHQWQKTNVHYSSIILKQAERSIDQFGDQLLSVSLNVNASDTPIRATTLIEVSNDLQNWKSLSKPYDFYFLPGKDNHLSNNNLTLSSYLSRDAKYLRLATLSNVQGFTGLINSISGSYQHVDNRTQATQWMTVQPHKIDGEEGAWQLDLPSLVPVSAIRMSNADNIVYYQGRFLTEPHRNPQITQKSTKKSGKKKLKQAIKNAAKGKSRKIHESTRWRTVTSFNQYKLMLEAGSVESPDLQFSNIKSRVWQIKFDVPANLTADQLPIIEIGWKPSQLNFIAQGQGPFTLHVGRNLATKKVVFPTQLKNLRASTEKVALLSQVNVGASNAVLDESDKADSNNVNWSKLLLWAILLFGVSLMFYMAYSLLRSMNKDS